MADLKNALVIIQEQMAKADEARRKLENLTWNASIDSIDNDESTIAGEILGDNLRGLYRSIAILAEAAKLDATATDIRSQMHRHEKLKNFSHFRFRVTDLGEWIEAPALDEIRDTVDILRALFGGGQKIDGFQQKLSEFEQYLRRTAVVMLGEKVTPQSEMDIQRVMHRFLKNVYTEFTTEINFPHPIKTFKPDCGVATFNAAVEFKFVTTETELKTAYSGILEDISGYTSSKDWTQFYSVIYMSEPFETEDRFKAGMMRTGNADAWTPIFVHGPEAKSLAKAVKKATKISAQSKTTV